MTTPATIYVRDYAQIAAQYCYMTTRTVCQKALPSFSLQFLYLKYETDRNEERGNEGVCQLQKKNLQMIKWISRRHHIKAAHMLLQREDTVATIERDLKITPSLKAIAAETFEEHKTDGKCYDRVSVRIGKELVFMKQRSMDLIEDATELNCEETDRRKTMLHDAVRINEDENVENDKLIEFDGSPLTNWEKEKPDIVLYLGRCFHSCIGAATVS
ncbi:hypothetical protein Tcan_18443 [Toxocara canis]|uniref:Uncharacterized protein n=1 Tax=Toxocara canis TaxID=6265 RepID=A0A0B2UWM7_TOXCA|nr:hypothetical protein Tcan_18443 [Toxocara canis]